MFLLSLLYRLIVSLRNRLYNYGLLPIYKNKLPVICVGNITVGGNGKTPLVIFLVKKYQSEGKKPVVLTRGYGGKIKGPYQIKDKDSFEDTGDEALLIKKNTRVEVIISADRVKGAKYIENNNLGDIIIMDDGFQHRRLARDENILCFDISSQTAVDKVASGKLLPYGRLREPIEVALERTDKIALNARAGKLDVSLAEQIINLIKKDLPVLKTFLEFLKPEKIFGEAQVLPEKWVSFSAIANSEGFQKSLISLGYKVKEHFDFSDHHKFSLSDIKKIQNKYPDYSLICTEKDAIKLEAEEFQEFCIYYLPVCLKVY